MLRETLSLLCTAKAFQIPEFHIISIQLNKYETLHSISVLNFQTNFQDVDKHSPFEKI